MDGQTKELGERKDAASKAAAARLLGELLVERWMADESGYDEGVWPELKEALDRNRPGYRELFPDDCAPQA